MILITRPINSAKNLELNFKKLGLKSHISPLTSIRISTRQINFQSDHIYIVASQHTIQFLKLQKNFIKEISHLKFLVIGKATSIKLKNIGAQKIMYVADNRNGLLCHMKNKKYNYNLSYLCGSNRDNLFFTNFLNTKYTLQFVEVYKVCSSRSLSRKLINQLSKRRIKIVLIFSLANAELFINIALKNNINVNKYTYICMSRKISDYLKLNHCNNVTFVKNPTLTNMIKRTLKISKKIKI